MFGRQDNRLFQKTILDECLEISILARRGHQAVKPKARHILKTNDVRLRHAEFDDERTGGRVITDGIERVGVHGHHFNCWNLLWHKVPFAALIRNQFCCVQRNLNGYFCFLGRAVALSGARLLSKTVAGSGEECLSAIQSVAAPKKHAVKNG